MAYKEGLRVKRWFSLVKRRGNEGLVYLQDRAGRLEGPQEISGPTLCSVRAGSSSLLRACHICSSFKGRDTMNCPQSLIPDHPYRKKSFPNI